VDLAFESAEKAADDQSLARPTSWYAIPQNIRSLSVLFEHRITVQAGRSSSDKKIAFALDYVRWRGPKMPRQAARKRFAQGGATVAHGRVE
jgi:hypothetical protein